MSRCEEHNIEKRTEPLTRFDGSQIGSLTVEVCDRCDGECDDLFDAFLDNVRSGNFGADQ